MQEILVQQGLEIILVAVLTPLIILLFKFIAPLKSKFKIVEVDPEEGKKLAGKRTLGCFAHWIILAILLGLSKDILWMPLYNWIHTYDGAIFVERIEGFSLYLLAAYLAFPLSIIMANLWFTNQHGEEKFNLLQNHYTSQYNFNNPKFEKIMLNSASILAVFIILLLFVPVTFVTNDEFCFRENLNFRLERKKITEIDNIEYLESRVYRDGECSGPPNYRLTFKDGVKFLSTDINSHFPSNSLNTNQIYLFLSKKSGKNIIRKERVPIDD